MYTNIHYFCIFLIFQFFFLFFFFFLNFFMKNKVKQNWKIIKQKHVNKAKYKTRCKCMRRKDERKRSIHGDDTNVLVKEFKPFAIKRFGNKSAFWSSVWINSRERVPSSTSSLMKWCRISMCLVQECWIGFLEMLIVRISALKSYCMMLCMLLCMTLCMI